MIDKFAEILTATKQPTLKEQIIQKCHLTSETFDKNVRQLLQSGMLDAYPAVNLRGPGNPSKRRLIYQTSRKGSEFLKRYNALLSLLEIPLKYYPKVKILMEKDQT